MKKLTVRNIPDPVLAELNRIAAGNRDSLNKTVLLALEQFVGVVPAQVSGKVVAQPVVGSGGGGGRSR